MTPAGFTTDGLPVIAGVAAMSCTHGIPLEITLMHFRERGQVVDWLDYVRGCRVDGHKLGTIRARILAAVGDVYGPEVLPVFTQRLDAVLATLGGKP